MVRTRESAGTMLDYAVRVQELNTGPGLRPGPRSGYYALL